MGDVKDILGMSRAGGGRPEPKKEQARPQRPAGMSREAFALLDGSHPLPPGLAGDLRKKGDLQGLKEKRKAGKGNVTWQWQAFENQARSDGLRLRHWVKCLRDASGGVRPAVAGDYRFAKFNKKVPVARFDDEEWASVVARDPDWDRPETEYLLDLCERFDLRFLVIADRYQWPGKERSLEDLKARYYSVARQLTVAREGAAEECEHLAIVKAPYDAAHEKERKRALVLMLRRTPQQEAEENALLERAKGLEAARRAEEAARRAAAPQQQPQQSGAGPEAALPTFTAPVPPGTPSLLGPGLQPTKPPRPGAVLRRAHTREQAEAMLAGVSGGPRAAKLLEGMLADLSAADPPKIGTRAVCGTWLAMRAEILQMLELKTRLLSRQGAATPASSADGRSKRGTKHKAGKFEEDVEMPKEKRPRVAKRFADEL